MTDAKQLREQVDKSGQVIQINDLIGKLIAEDNRVLEELRKCTISQN